MRRNLGADAGAYRLGLQSTMRAQTLLPGTKTVLRSDGVGPVIPIRRVAHSLRTSSAQPPGAYATRLAMRGSTKLRADASIPKTYDLGQPPSTLIIPSFVPFVTTSLLLFVT